MNKWRRSDPRMNWVTDVLIFTGMAKKFSALFFRIARAALPHLNAEPAQTRRDLGLRRDRERCCDVAKDLLDTAVDRFSRGVDDERGALWRLVGRGDAGELRDLARACAPIESLGIAPLAGLEIRSEIGRAHV